MQPTRHFILKGLNMKNIFKKLCAILVLASLVLVHDVRSQTGSFQSFGRISILLNNANVAEAISPTRLMVNQFEMYVTDNDVGPVYIGNSSVDTTWIPRIAGSTTYFTASAGDDIIVGRTYDLSQIYLVSGTAGDTVTIQYGLKQ